MEVISKKWFYMLLSLAILVTLLYGYYNSLIGLTFFALLPYIVAIYLLFISKHISSIITAKVVTVFIICVGLYFLIDTTYMERKLAYKFSFLFMPIWQLTMLLVSGLVVFLGNNKENHISHEREDVA